MDVDVMCVCVCMVIWRKLTHTCIHAHLGQKIQTGEMEGARWVTLLTFFSESFSLISVRIELSCQSPLEHGSQIRHGNVKQSKESESVILLGESFSDVETKVWRKCHKMLVQYMQRQGKYLEKKI